MSRAAPSPRWAALTAATLALEALVTSAATAEVLSRGTSVLREGRFVGTASGALWYTTGDAGRELHMQRRLGAGRSRGSHSSRGPIEASLLGGRTLAVAELNCADARVGRARC